MTLVNGHHWCGFPMRPVSVKSFSGRTREPRDYAMQILAEGIDVVIGGGLVRTYNGTRQGPLDWKLRGVCKDFAGRYVLARLSEPFIQLHDVISTQPVNQRMEWLTEILKTRSHRNSPYVLATNKFSAFDQQQYASVLLKKQQAECWATPKAPVKTSDWLRFASVESARQFIKKIHETG